MVGFTAVLRGAGLQITTDRVAAFLSALDELDITSQWQTYWAGRLTLCADPDDLPRYNQAFEEWFTPRRGGATRVIDERKPPPKLASLTPSSQEQAEGEGESDPTTIRARASGAEVLRHRDLAELTPAEREHLRKLLALLRPDPPKRPSRRCATAVRCARCCTATGPGAPARSCCWWTSPGRWSPTPTRSCASRTS
jgi:uncharacterized protein with von Willebrand factor type A (vWA) domain